MASDQEYWEERFKQHLTRRGLLRDGAMAGATLLGLGLIGCGGSAGSASTPAKSTGTKSSSASVKPGAYRLPGTWNELVAAAKKEGQVVVAGSPTPATRKALPPAFKKKYGIDVNYLGENTFAVTARMSSERPAGLYTVDLALTGADSAYGTFLANKWLAPLAPAMMAPDVKEPNVWTTPGGKPWFRDPQHEYVLQVFDTIEKNVTLNTKYVTPAEIPNANALLDPKWRGKMCAFDPSVNGIGLAIGAVIYQSKGAAFCTKLYKGQQVVLSKNYSQVAQWVVQGEYPIGIAVAPSYIGRFAKIAHVPYAQPTLAGLEQGVGGGFGQVVVIDPAPHPNAARLFANWVAGPEGLALFAKSEQEAPVRKDIKVTWLSPSFIPKPGVKYIDGYSYAFDQGPRLKVRGFFKKMLA